MNGKNKPEVSVIVPTYDRTTLLVRAVDSALAQTYRNFELIVVDDGSRTDTEKVIAPFRSQLNYSRIEHAGQSAARNVAIGKSRGRLIAFLDSDDVWFPDKLARQVAAMNQHGARFGFCFTDAQALGDPARKDSFFRETGFDPGAEIGAFENPLPLVMRSKQPMLLPTVVVSRELLASVGGFDEDMSFAEDTLLFLRLSLRTGYVCVNRTLASFNVASSYETISAKRKSLVYFQCVERMYKRFLDDLDGSYPKERREIRGRLSAALAHQAVAMLSSADSGRARERMWRAVNTSPSARRLAKFLLMCACPRLLRGREHKSNSRGGSG